MRCSASKFLKSLRKENLRILQQIVPVGSVLKNRVVVGFDSLSLWERATTYLTHHLESTERTLRIKILNASRHLMASIMLMPSQRERESRTPPLRIAPLHLITFSKRLKMIEKIYEDVEGAAWVTTGPHKHQLTN
jgi:hypothetical protein